MALNVGSRLAHYDVTALIGEGGMGQVYQATDTKLNRPVALMVTSTREAHLSFSPLITGSVIATLSLVVVAGVAFVLLGSPTGTGGDTRASILPAVNALLNGTSAVLLTVGYVCIRRKKVIAHKTCMATAFVVSSLFLVSYLIHHYRVGAVPFAGEGWLRGLYFSVLIPHVVLAALVVPLALTTIHHGLISRFDKHVRIARWTLPIWLYVSVSGVLVYWMLYWLG